MSPSDFWACDTWTVADALEGYAMSKGVKPEEQKNTTLTRESVQRIKAMIKREEAKEAGRK